MASIATIIDTDMYTRYSLGIGGSLYSLREVANNCIVYPDKPNTSNPNNDIFSESFIWVLFGFLEIRIILWTDFKKDITFIFTPISSQSIQQPTFILFLFLLNNYKIMTVVIKALL